MIRKLSLLLGLIVLLFSCEMQRFDAYATFDNLKTLESFNFLKAENDNLFTDSIGSINHSARTITLFVPPQLDLTGLNTGATLIPDFTIRGYEKVEINGFEAKSGLALPFTSGTASPNSLTIISEDGTTENWRLILIEELRVEVFSDDPLVNPTHEEIYQDNADSIAYIQFNAPVDFNTDPDSLTNQLNIANPNFEFSSIVLTDHGQANGLDANYLFQADLTAMEGKWWFQVDANTVDDADTGATALNLNSDGIWVTYDNSPPNIPFAIEESFIMDAAGEDFLRIRIFAGKDNLSLTAPEDLRYQIYYNSSDNPDEVTDNANTVDTAAPENVFPSATEYLQFSGDSGVFEIPGLTANRFHHLVLRVVDKVDKEGFTNEEIFYTQDAVYVKNGGTDSAASPHGLIDQPFATIQPALDYAYARKIREVRLEEGIYYPDTDYLQLYPSVGLYGGYSPGFTTRNPDVYDSLITGDRAPIQLNSDPNLIDYSKDPNNENHLIYQSNSTNDETIIDGIIFSHSNATTTGGGAIYSEYGLTIRDCDFIANYSDTAGGAIYFSGVSSNDILIEDCSFYLNGAANSGGAIAAIDTGSPYDSKIILNNNDFLQNSTFSTSVSTKGGAVYAERFILEMSGNEFAENESVSGSPDGKGGALAIMDSAETTLEENFFYLNNAKTSGGAIDIDGGFSIKFKPDNSFMYNYTLDGGNGGAINIENSSNTLPIEGCSFINNGTSPPSLPLPAVYTDFTPPSAIVGTGGAIAVDSSYALIIYGTSFLGNYAKNGGALYSYDLLDVPVIVSNLFEGNKSINGSGGVAFINASSSYETVFYRNYFKENAATGSSTNQAGAFFIMGNFGTSYFVENIFYKNIGEASSSFGSFQVLNSNIQSHNNLFFKNKGVSGTDTIVTQNTESFISRNDLYVAEASNSLPYFVKGNPISNLDVTNGLFYPDSPLTLTNIPSLNTITNLWGHKPLFQGNVEIPEGPDGEWGTNDDSFIPLLNSPVINGGTNTFILNMFSSFVMPILGISDAVDIREADRIIHGLSDIGPYEYHGLDTEAPVPGAVTSFSSSGIEIIAAEDSVYSNESYNGQLSYRFVYRNTPIDSVATALDNGLVTEILNWFTPTAYPPPPSAKTIHFSFVPPATAGTYYFAVVVRDGDNNTAMYPVQTLVVP